MKVEEEAREAVDGDRGLHYGPPRVNHERTAALWTGYLEAKYGTAEGALLTAEDVCYMNILQKIARGMHVQTRDGIVDIIGYSINIAKLREED